MSEFRWKRGLLHALIPFVLVIAGGLVLFVATDPVDPEKAGEGVGRFAAVALLVGLGISYLAQTGKKKAAVMVAVGLVGVVAAIAVVAVTAGKHHAPPVRYDLLDAGGRLRHPRLHFSIKRPPVTYRDSPQIAAAMGRQDPDTIIYAYAEEPPTALLVISVMYDRDPTRSEFKETMRGIRSGLEASMAKQMPGKKLQMVRDDIDGDDRHLLGHVHAIVEPLHLRIEARALPGETPVIVVLTTIATDDTTLADVLASFQP